MEKSHYKLRVVVSRNRERKVSVFGLQSFHSNLWRAKDGHHHFLSCLAHPTKLEVLGTQLIETLCKMNMVNTLKNVLYTTTQLAGILVVGFI